MGNIPLQPSPTQIWYTSTDGVVITPSAPSFCQTIVSNSYDQGWGIITLDRPVTEICSNAFNGCKNLARIIFPTLCTSIAQSACQGCTSLERVILPESITDIGPQAFIGCSALLQISIPDTCINIAHNAFESTTNIVRYAKPTPAANQIWYTAMQQSAIETAFRIADAEIVSNNFRNGVGIIEFDSAISVVNKNAFYGCKSLVSVTLPEGVRCIEDYAFAICKNLITVTLPDSVQDIGTCAFEGCSSLQNINLCNGITNISKYAFARCTSLKSLTLPDSITTLSEGLLSGCKSLTKITLGCNLKEINPHALEQCSIDELYLRSDLPKFHIANLPLTAAIKIYVPHNTLESYIHHLLWQPYSAQFSEYKLEE